MKQDDQFLGTIRKQDRTKVATGETKPNNEKRTPRRDG